MRTGIFLAYSGGFREAVDHVAVLEQQGVDIVLVAEAYSFDAISQLGYLAARTSRIELGTGVLPIYTRTPTLLAMTAAGLDYVCDGRAAHHVPAQLVIDRPHLRDLTAVGVVLAEGAISA